MSLYDFQTIERFDEQTIAESKAELSKSEQYIIWRENIDEPGEDEIHFQHRDREYIPPDDRALIETVYERAYGSACSFGNDGHAIVYLHRWENPDGEIVGSEELFEKLLEVL